ncbi:ribonuclease III [Chlamydia sp.]|uniref:ribonuclease III n=1 Tax=Chlamydia sp. TaxID=35827 RepID=UPI0025BA2445|nr:ribonuclease III [Chlamydia sp.]MBQ8498302.1 ribonuclease III [Chlamydia sp.]
MQHTVDIQTIESKLNFTFSHPRLLITALTHPSYRNESPLAGEDSERLEFLGDAVLGLIVTEHLFLLFPSLDEGLLSTTRAALVNAEACFGYTQKLSLGEHLLIGRGEKMQSDRGKISAYANLFEAVLGAVYLDGGLSPARQIVVPLLPDKNAILPLMLVNPKNRLQQLTQQTLKVLPSYTAVPWPSEDGSPGYRVQVSVNGELWGEGFAGSKKEAEKLAAKQALSTHDNKN